MSNQYFTNAISLSVMVVSKKPEGYALLPFPTIKGFYYIYMLASYHKMFLLYLYVSLYRIEAPFRIKSRRGCPKLKCVRNCNGHIIQCTVQSTYKRIIVHIMSKHCPKLKCVRNVQIGLCPKLNCVRIKVIYSTPLYPLRLKMLRLINTSLMTISLSVMVLSMKPEGYALLPFPIEQKLYTYGQ